MPINKLILGDNLEILKGMEAESVDLIYLDPPFFSDRNYEVIWGDDGEVRSFQDRWAGGVDHYIAWLYERVEQMHRILKSTGSIYLHCDWHADAYIRVYILDKIFGAKNFRNEMAWCYSNSGRSKKWFSKKHDTIFLYTKSEESYWNKEYKVPYTENYIRTHFTDIDDNGNICRKRFDAGKWRTYYPEGMIPNDWWEDISSLNSMSKERIGYPTQKPEALLERIIKASSNEGDVILDPFVGGGTTVVVADRLKRQWIGIDQSTMAIKVTEERLQKTGISNYANK